MQVSWLRVLGVASVAVAAGAFLGCGSGDFNAAGDNAAGDDLMSVDPGSDDNAAVDDSDYSTGSEALMSCANPDGTNSVMAAFAVAVAQELGRWNASVDFIQNNTSGMSESSYGPQQAIKLASGSNASGPIGKSRCSDGKCARVQALLDMQYDQYNNKVYIQGSGSTKVLLSPSALRSRMFAKWNDQKACDLNAKDGDINSCTKEQNVLKYVSAAAGGCDTNFTFSVKGTTGALLKYPNQLKNELRFADSSNPYINFQNLGNGNVSIDPTYGLDDDYSGAPAMCTAACTKISPTVNYAGTCCSCGGVNKTFARSPYNAITYLCQ
jgi:hypothetical protein